MKKILNKLYKHILIIFKVDAFSGFWSIIASIYHKKNKIGNFFVNKKHKSIKKFLMKKYHSILLEDKVFSNDTINKNATIWVFWWQGENEMPKIVQMCLNSKCKNLGSHKIQLITKKNFFEFIDVPQYLLEKLDQGKINLANFADVYRTMLLSKFGGIWMDATIFQSTELSSTIYEYPFVSAKRKSIDVSSLYPANSRWGTYFLAVGKNNELMYFVSKILLAYWQDFDIIIDYGLIDYVICICMEKRIEINKMIEDSPFFCEKIHKLQEILNKEFSKTEYDNLINDNSLFKLTYKINFNDRTNDGKKTTYGYLMERN